MFDLVSLKSDIAGKHGNRNTGQRTGRVINLWLAPVIAYNEKKNVVGSYQNILEHNNITITHIPNRFI